MHLTSLGILNRLPTFPSTVIPAIEGLEITQAHYCPHCPAAYPSEAGHKRHLSSHRSVEKTPSTIGPVQHFDNALGRTFFRVTTQPPSVQASIDHSKPILKMLKEIEDQQRSLVVETDIRNVSPWLRITQWHEMFKDYDLKLLHSMVAPPSDVEFPNLQKSVLFTFKGASGLIDTTTTLVLQILLSPNPHEECAL